MSSPALQASPRTPSQHLAGRRHQVADMGISAGAVVFALVEAVLASGLTGSRELGLSLALFALLPGLLVVALRGRVGRFGFGSTLFLMIVSGAVGLIAHGLAFFSGVLDQVEVLSSLALASAWAWTQLVGSECGPADLGIGIFVSDCACSIGETIMSGLIAWACLLPGRPPAPLLAWEQRHKGGMQQGLTPSDAWNSISRAREADQTEDDLDETASASSRRAIPRGARGEGHALARDQVPKASESADPTFTVDVKHFPARPITEILAELDGLIGLNEVKDQVRDLMALVEIGRQRLALGLPEAGVSMHLRLLGAPGTGKTTVARLIAELLSAAGALPEAKLIEADRAALVGGYQGHTAAKVNAVVDAALGGVLFIDEAYALSQGAGDTFGSEALTTLLARAESDRQHLAIVLAGYAPEMADLMDQNPGLRSRFHRAITFADFSVEELMEVAAREAGLAHRVLTDGALVELRAGLDELLATKDRHWGNGREVRSLIELAKLAQARRLKDATALTASELTELDAADVLSALAQRQRAATPA